MAWVGREWKEAWKTLPADEKETLGTLSLF